MIETTKRSYKKDLNKNKHVNHHSVRYRKIRKTEETEEFFKTSARFADVV